MMSDYLQGSHSWGWGNFVLGFPGVDKTGSLEKILKCQFIDLVTILSWLNFAVKIKEHSLVLIWCKKPFGQNVLSKKQEGNCNLDYLEDFWGLVVDVMVTEAWETCI